MSVQSQIDALHRNWVWVKDWQDFSSENTAGRLVTFTRKVHLSSIPQSAIIHCTADTRYKLLINGTRVCIGPSRSSAERWLYDTIDLSPFLSEGENTITFVVMRYFYATRAAMTFVRTGFPALTVAGSVGEEDINTATSAWTAVVDYGTTFPMGLEDDVFLHINERSQLQTSENAEIVPYGLRLVNGELPPWRLQPREIPLPEQTAVGIHTFNALDSAIPEEAWQALLSSSQALTLPPSTSHTLDVQADSHSTAFLKWTFRASEPTQVRLKVTYSEGYELEPRRYPWLRTKADRLDSTGLILGPHDEVTLSIGAGDTMYEPFWFRTFRMLRMEIVSGASDVELVSLEATQVNYPMAVKASWSEPQDEYSQKIFEISIRTMRNCMLDGYSDCPFYEQLSYSGDTGVVAIFHSLLSGDDRLIRQTLTSFAGSVTPEGLTQSRYPSQVQQIIAAFPLNWVQTICDHMLYFGDAKFSKSFLPLIDGVLNFFDRHVDELGLVSGLPSDVWQYVDWVTGWHETDEHPSKGVPTAGRKSNRHTFISMLYGMTLKSAATLVRQVGRPQYAEEYEQRAEAISAALRKHCYDSKLRIFTDSTSDVPPDTPTPYSQHSQVFAVLCGAVDPADSARLLREAFRPDTTLGKCSYFMVHYAFRAFAKAGIYEEMYRDAWQPWRRMIKQNMSTWEEDDVRQRSDCHAWGSVPVYEYLSEVAGIKPIEPGFKAILFAPRVSLSAELEAKVAVGSENVAHVSWGTDKVAKLRLDKAARVVTRSADGQEKDHGVVQTLEIRP